MKAYLFENAVYTEVMAVEVKRSVGLFLTVEQAETLKTIATRNLSIPALWSHCPSIGREVSDLLDELHPALTAAGIR